jgi:hypothetical protein
MAFEPILHNIGKHIALEPDEAAFFTALLQYRDLPKKEHLLKEGQLCRTINYVESGALRAFHCEIRTLLPHHHAKLLYPRTATRAAKPFPIRRRAIRHLPAQIPAVDPLPVPKADRLPPGHHAGIPVYRAQE